jgi:fructose-1,6-bisphosphatase/inositol monophosphatase family enzyme
MIEGKKRISAIIHDNNPLKVKQSIWDVTAPQIIVEEAGGVFLNSRGARYDPLEPDMIIIAKSQELADEILSLTN